MSVENDNTLQAGDYDCGDGVPALTILPTGDGSYEGPTHREGSRANPEPQVSVRVFALAASVITQVLIGLVIAVGGNAVVGAVAAVTIMACSLLLVAAEAFKPSDKSL